MRSPARAGLVTVLAMTLGACTRHDPPAPDAAPQPSPQPEPPPTPAAPVEPVAETGEAPAPVEARDQVEDPELSKRTGQTGRKLNPEIAGVGTKALEAAFPERAGGLERSRLHGSAAGTAGMWADSASAAYGEEGAEISIHVSDMIRVSECEPGSWNAYVDDVESGKKKTDYPERAVTVGKHRAIYVEIDDSPKLGRQRVLGFRLGDRCDLEISGEGAKKAKLVAVAKDLALDDLEAACSKRDAGGLFGP
jgi:hypothetical protein